MRRATGARPPEDAPRRDIHPCPPLSPTQRDPNWAQSLCSFSAVCCALLWSGVPRFDTCQVMLRIQLRKHAWPPFRTYTTAHPSHRVGSEESSRNNPSPTSSELRSLGLAVGPCSATCPSLPETRIATEPCYPPPSSHPEKWYATAVRVGVNSPARTASTK